MHTLFSTGRHDYYYYFYYHMLLYAVMIMMMMIMMTETQNGHNSANFEGTTFGFCMVIDIKDTYRMMMM